MQTPFINVDLNTHMKEKYNWKGNMIMTVLSPVLFVSDHQNLYCLTFFNFVVEIQDWFNSLRQYFTE